MKVLFLDIDGVIASATTAKRNLRINGGERTYGFVPECVDRVNMITSQTGAKIVLSTTWRKLYPFDVLVNFMEQQGITSGKIISATPDLEGWYRARGRPTHVDRGEEILHWIDSNSDIVKSYVALDDEADYQPLPAFRWVRVENGWRDGGIQHDHAMQAINVLRIPV